MKLTLCTNVNVVNWEREPLFKLSSEQVTSLALALKYTREIISDSHEVLSTYVRHQHVHSVDQKMARDYFGDQVVAIEALEKYFGLDLPTDDARVGTIVDKFKSMLEGVSKPFDVVVGHIFDDDDLKEGVCDSLRFLFSGKLKAAAKELTGIHRNTRGWVDPRASHGLHRIHLNVSVWNHFHFTPSEIARVLVHEASHKWAGTKDRHDMKDGSRFSGYKNANEYRNSGVSKRLPDGSRNPQYAVNDLKYNGQATNPANAFVDLSNNADSYAWGGRLIWKRKRHIAKGM